jgi:hypothetical protein
LKVEKNQVRNLAELGTVLGYADTVSVDPNLHLVVHSKGGEKQLGFQTDLEIIRRNSKKCSQNLRGLSTRNFNRTSR